MGIKPLNDYLRMFRQRSGLTQNELAGLLGCGKGAKISGYECSDRQPGLETAIAYCLVFGVSYEELFTGKVQRLRRGIATRAGIAVNKLAKQPDSRLNRQKLKFLQEVARRVDLKRECKSGPK
jgi:transcriptional regulator with XRE-family HTH domain